MAETIGQAFERAKRERDELVAALKPFNAAAGELFATNHNRDDLIVQGPDFKLTAGDFFDLRALFSRIEARNG